MVTTLFRSPPFFRKRLNLTKTTSVGHFRDSETTALSCTNRSSARGRATLPYARGSEEQRYIVTWRCLVKVHFALRFTRSLVTGANSKPNNACHETPLSKLVSVLFCCPCCMTLTAVRGGEFHPCMLHVAAPQWGNPRGLVHCTATV